MKILVINGSPKRDNSDTMHITRAFLDGMNDVSQSGTITEIMLTEICSPMIPEEVYAQIVNGTA